MSRVSRDSRVSRERACLVRPSISAKLVMLCVRKEMLKLNVFSLGRGAWPGGPALTSDPRTDGPLTGAVSGLKCYRQEPCSHT